MRSASGTWILTTMDVASPSLRPATTRSSLARSRRPAGSRPATQPFGVVAQPPRRLELDTISSDWQLALDAAHQALAAAADTLPAAELGERRRELARERLQTADALVRVAQAIGVRPLPWLSPRPMSMRMLGLPPTVRACLFDLDGVLTDSAALHAWAWGEAFDEFLLRMSDNVGWQFIPFDRETDYRKYLDGRPRLEGIHAFLGSRGVRVPEGRADDSSRAETACGLAARKGEALARGLQQRGVTALAGARRYLEAAGHAGLKRAVVSASTTTLPMLELAGLATLVEARVDAEVMRDESLRSRPAPDLLFAACRRLGVQPETAVTFTHSAAGVAAGHTAGLTVVGIGEGAHGELLSGFGAERVVPLLSALLDPSLTT
jgi:beta-phosphoglucomutase-like phosphatase (HAD superfamily)